jgi:hypothetical protein
MTQGNAPGVSEGKGTGGDHPKRVPVQAVREELARVLASHEFHASKRSQDFLRYVIEHTLSGHADMLKERTIGIEVFGRTSDYDPSDDATVRVKAGEVRKRLGLYYADQGAQNPVRIELPLGTYVPEFRFADAPEPASQARAGQVLPKRSPSRALWIWAIAAALCIAATAILWLRMRPSDTALDEFWSPVLQGASPVMLCAAFVPDAYGLTRDPANPRPLRVEDFVPVPDQFVGGGDLIATSRLAAMLTRMEHPYRLRVGSDVSFHDLRAGPAILVGYSYTRWKEISSQMRYFIDTSRRPVGITDNGAPTKWTLPNLPTDRKTDEDYAIVSRVFHPATHAMLVEIAGITQYGTDAAGDLVTNPDLLAEAFRGAPAGWKSKNLQLVLHVKVISGAPSSPKVVAANFW